MKFHSNTLGPVPLQLASMIDIMLVPSMFFILSYKFAQDETDLDIKVPSSKEGVETTRVHGEILVNIRADGSVSVEGKPYTLAQLHEKLVGVVRVYKDQPIRVRGDANVIYQRLVEVLDTCRRAGIWNISFATQAPSASPEAPPTQPGGAPKAGGTPASGGPAPDAPPVPGPAPAPDSITFPPEPLS